MANKQIAVFVVDCSPSMGATDSAGVSGLDRAKATIRAKISNKMMFPRKNDFLGVVLVGHSSTANALADQLGGFEHINVFKPIQAADVQLYEDLEELETSDFTGDLMDGVLVGMQLIIETCKHYKYAKSLYVFTDAQSELADTDQYEQIAREMVAQGMSLTLIGTRFQLDDEEDDDDDEGAEGGSSSQGEGTAPQERLLRAFADKVGGHVLSDVDASDPARPMIKQVSQVTKFRGDWEISETLRIPVYCYSKVSVATLPTLKKESIPAMDGGDEDGSVVMDRSYHVKGATGAPTGSVSEGRVKGFRYGPSIVPFAEADESAASYTDAKGMRLVGFVPQRMVPHHILLSTVDIICSPPDATRSAAQLAAMVRACHTKQQVPIVRFIPRNGATAVPKLFALFPKVKATTQFFYCAQIPFKEDMRYFPFAPLQTGSVVPDRGQIAAWKALVAAMSLRAPPDEDEEGPGAELLRPKDTPNPSLQRFYRAVETRALDPEARLELKPLPGTPVPPPAAVLDALHTAFKLKVLDPAKVKAEKAKPVSLQQLQEKTTGELSLLTLDEDDSDEDDDDDVVPGAAGASSGGAAAAAAAAGPLGLAGTTSAAASASARVTTGDPVGSFLAMVRDRSRDNVAQAVQQMQAIIEGLLASSFLDTMYPRAAECLKALRGECIREDEWAAFNTFLRALHSREKTKHAGFFDMCRDDALVLISSDECSESTVDRDRAAQMFQDDASLSVSLSAPKSAADQSGADALFDDF